MFGTFLYHNADAAAPADWTTKLVPVGAMWGNDHGKTDPAEYLQGSVTAEVGSLISAGQLFDLSKRKTLGWFERVNGTFDNPRSSCLSCHATAQVHRTEIIKHFLTPALAGSAGTDQNRMLWFRDIPAGGTFTFTSEQLALVNQGNPNSLRADWTPQLMADFVGTDYSLQLRMAIENARFFDLQRAINSLIVMSNRLPEPMLTATAVERFQSDAAAEAARIEWAGEP